MANSKEYNARYYQEHRDEIKAKKKEQYEADPVKYKERAKAWVEANREQWNAYMRERRKKLKAQKINQKKGGQND